MNHQTLVPASKHQISVVDVEFICCYAVETIFWHFNVTHLAPVAEVYLKTDFWRSPAEKTKDVFFVPKPFSVSQHWLMEPRNIGRHFLCLICYVRARGFSFIFFVKILLHKARCASMFPPHNSTILHELKLYFNLNLLLNPKILNAQGKKKLANLITILTRFESAHQAHWKASFIF